MQKNDKRNSLKISILAAAIATLPFSAHAAGLGRLTVLSALGEPLRAELEISASREETGSLAARVAPLDAFRKANIDYVPVLSGLRFTLDKRPGGQTYFRVSSERPINDPFLDFLVELNWSSGRLVREYTFLLDPPEAKLAAQSAPARAVDIPAAVAEIKVEAPVAPTPQPAEEKPVAATVKPQAADSRSGETRTVKRGDTLAGIARAVKPEGVSLDQMLVALFQSNQSTFDSNNMNRLRAGKILTIPEADTVAAVNEDEARKIIRAQSADFAAYRKRLAEAAASAAAMPAEAPKQEVSGKITPKVEDKAPTIGKDKLQIARTETAKTGRGAEEDAVARDNALREANARIAELEKNLSELQKLADLKSQGGADLQKQAQTVKPVPTPAPSAEQAAGLQVPPPVVAPAQAPGKSAPAAKSKKKTLPPPPPPEPNFLEKNAPYLYGGGGLLALLAGFFGFRAWQRKRAGATAIDSFGAEVVSDNSIFSASVGQRVDTDGSEAAADSGAIAEPGEAAESVDPLQEAEVYLAYGRDSQAEEILLAALEATPTRLAIHGKLLEIYVARHSVPQFVTLAEDVHRQTQGTGPEWEHALALGRTLDPTNPLFGGRSAPVPSVQPVVEAPTPIPPPAMESPAPAMAEPAPEPVPETIDFDLDLGAPEPSAPAAAPVEPAAEAEENSALDFDLGSDFPAANAAEPESTTMAAAPNALDIDFDLPDMGAVPASDAADLAGQPLDFDFDLGDSGTAPVAAPPVDLSVIDLNLDSEAAPDNPEVATKLELAQAYQEMGDQEGARELLQEVLKEGSAAQQDLARSKLAALG